MSIQIASRVEPIQDFSHQKITSLLTQYGLPKEISLLVCKYHLQEVWKKIEPADFGFFGSVVHLITGCMNSCVSTNYMQEAVNTANISLAILAIQQKNEPTLSKVQFASLLKNEKHEFIHFMFEQIRHKPNRREFKDIYEIIKTLDQPLIAKALKIYVKHANGLLCAHQIDYVRTQFEASKDQVFLKFIDQLRVYNDCRCVEVINPYPSREEPCLYGAFCNCYNCRLLNLEKTWLTRFNTKLGSWKL
jgi:hypothetical protein